VPVPATAVTPDEYVAAILQIAERDASIARVLREIVSLETAVRSSALDLVAAHLRVHAAAGDVIDCIDALKRDAVAQRIAERLGAARARAPGDPASPPPV
jgi:capsular polysaccharide biosynthesis protein